MKKITALFSAITLILGLCACGQASVGQSPSSIASAWQEQYDLGMRYLKEGNYEEAIIAFTAAIEIDPKQAPAYVGRGNAYVLSGETEENLTAAQADYEKAIELDEANVNAYIKLADVYVAKNDLQKAWTLLQQEYQETGNSTIRAKMEEIQAIIADSLRKTNLDMFEDIAKLVSAGDKRGLWECFLLNRQQIFNLSGMMVEDKLLVDTSYGEILFCIDGDSRENGFYVGDIQYGKRSGHGILVHAYSQDELSWRILESDWENDLPNGQFRWEQYDSGNGLAIHEGFLVDGFFNGEIIHESEFIIGGRYRIIKQQFNNGRQVPISGPDELGEYVVGEQQWDNEQPQVLKSSDLETQYGVFPFSSISTG